MSALFVTGVARYVDADGGVYESALCAGEVIPGCYTVTNPLVISTAGESAVTCCLATRALNCLDIRLLPDLMLLCLLQMPRRRPGRAA